jgi:triacylglycerol lipase
VDAAVQVDAAGSRDAGEMADAQSGSPAPYPIILMHGFGGFRDLGSLGYFFHVQNQLAATGETVYVSQAPVFDSSDARGEVVAGFVDTILATTGAAKVNLIAHSQGGLDARVVARLRPGRVASVTTISTPHLGTGLADLVVNDIGSLTPEVAAQFLDLLGAQLYGQGEVRARAGIEVLTHAGASRFNARVTDLPSTRYYSLAGRSALVPSTAPECAPSDGDPTQLVLLWRDTTDAINPVFAPLGAVIGWKEGSASMPAPNDGVVSVASSRWGRFLGCIPADHGDEVGQPLGVPAGSFGLPAFDYLVFYRGLIDFLRAEGH